MRAVRVKEHELFERVFWTYFEDGSRKPATLNLTPGRDVYGELLVSIDGSEYRVWDPYRSKLAAGIVKDIKNLGIKESAQVLYIGAASGTTASHVSDIVGEKGNVYCVEFSPRSMRELIDNVSSRRSNMHPILSDARLPEKYLRIARQVDVIYCDVAQPTQARILADNAEILLRPKGDAILAVKSRSIDVTLQPSEAIQREVEVLRRRGFKILDSVRLEPYERDHALLTAIRD